MKHRFWRKNWPGPLVVAGLCLAVQFLFPQSAMAEQLLTQAQPNRLVAETGINQTGQAIQAADDKPIVLPLPVINNIPARYVMKVPVTAYSSTVDQTDDTPFITASGSRVRSGIVAANFLPMGTRIRMPDYFGDKVFVVEDRMHSRFSNRVDVWMETRGEAVDWGVRRLNIEVL
ncbi:MAG: hypothetical protein WC621_00885 [Patescibacteria group bacterium]